MPLSSFSLRPSAPYIVTGLFALTLLSGVSKARANIVFNFTSNSILPGTDAYKSFQAAANNLSGIFADNMTVNLQIEYSSLGGNILGQTNTALYVYNYSEIRDALKTDASSTFDTTAVANLAPGDTYQRLINHTAENGNSATPYVSTNSEIFLSTANIKALRLTPPPNQNLDATIEFNSDYNSQFEFNHNKVAGSNKLDFTGIAEHEIIHSLGFISGVDDVNYSAGASEADLQASTLDLFRYSQNSVDGTYTPDKIIDMTADTRDKFFSVDKGQTQGAQFATGEIYGDQASHWKANLNYGIMDPYGRPGEVLNISQNDINALDVIGYNVAAVPETSTCTMLVIGLFSMSGIWAGKRRSPFAKQAAVSATPHSAETC